MMHEFLINNRENLAARCREKVSLRPGRQASKVQLQNGVPLFLEQLIRTLAVEQTSGPTDGQKISGPAGGGLALSEMGVSAAAHGRELLALGFTVDQVVHDYGDLCQAITDLAIERDAPFQIDEFRTLNRCLDNAIADAVTEFSYQRDFISEERLVKDNNERLGYFVHELRNLLGTTSLAFSAAKIGNLNLSGATGSILERSIFSLSKLIDDSLEDIKRGSHSAINLSTFSLSSFIEEAQASAELSARNSSCTFKVMPVDADLAISGNRPLLLAALANILQNAFKFTRPNTQVLLSAYASAQNIRIDVKDNCGGLPRGSEESIFLPFSQSGKNRTGAGLGLTIAKQSVAANGGGLSVHSIPDVGCIFTISLPRKEVVT
ncbi:sensor histidine kinase [Janthinobacterium sp. HLS12-2]|uniref:sensor histidine kinase n=1 Tax=Janthinobacterium sp. HLS12-2 TaxID=1259324 RepID=UPI003F1EC878